ncbi:hypothetical protein BEWA_028350 [Theileria equi strain WA]|uniref:Uncharacterized protein n=1 Tax=Theileria equi strain WA TaxID=1537102 RepID=L0AYA4_THEEQ|nr:hypothetical protein BEWA_028350 [Theileria equi strain WA]AFZ79986.1 hypothetical protein BEWA_028350 [Theileria equi strain WA]|eukprot:XP_004829652.1 hypothetical protein BEWA_028350 [Theileria equi strain WA]
MLTINIKKKCPKGDLRSSQRECGCSGDVTAYLRTISDKYREYKECKHHSKTFTIWNLNYDGYPLTYEDEGSSKLTKHRINELSTYYNRTYDSKKDHIEKPLLIRVKGNDGNYNWYENTGETSNTRWRKIVDDGFYEHENPTEKLREKLNKLTCDLHKLHIVDISATQGYNCACGEINVTVSEENNSDVEGYTKYNYKYNGDKNFVRYRHVSLEDNDEDGKLLDLNDITGDLSVYYWNEDEGRKRPLLIEVDVGGMKAYYENKGEQNNRKWTSIGPENADVGNGLRFPPNELKDKLKELTCRLFGPVIIDVSKKGPYHNPYCKNEECKNGECPDKVKVDSHSRLQLDGYKAVRHTYGGGSFTITGFTGEPNIYERKLPIWEVTEVVAFFPEGYKPFLVYVSSDGGRTKKWYSRTYNDPNKWEDISSQLKKPPHEVTGLEDTLKIIKQLQEILQRSEESQSAKQPGSGSEGDDEEEEKEEEMSSQPQQPPPVATPPDTPTALPLISPSGGSHAGSSYIGGGSVEVIGTEIEGVESVVPEIGPVIPGLIGEEVVPAADLSDQVPDAEFETRVLPEAPPMVQVDGDVVVDQPGDGVVYLEGTPVTYIGRLEGSELSGFTVDEGIPAADLSDQLPDIDSETIGLEYIPVAQMAATVGLQGQPAPVEHPNFTFDDHDFRHVYDGGLEGRVIQPDRKSSDPENIEYLEVPVAAFTPPEEPPPLHLFLPLYTFPPKQPARQQAQALPQQGSVSPHPPGQTPQEAKTLPGNSNPNTPEIIKTTISVTTGILGTSALACFAGWKLYNRFKGDPWVRQI